MTDKQHAGSVNKKYAEELSEHKEALTRRVNRIFDLRDSRARREIGEQEIQGALLATMSACLTLLDLHGADAEAPDWEGLMAREDERGG